MVTYKTVMATGNAPRRRQQLASISRRSSSHADILGNTESCSSQCFPSTQEIGTSTEYMACKDPKHKQQSSIFWQILTVLLAGASILFYSNHVYQKVMIARRQRPNRMTLPFLDESVYLQDIAKQQCFLKEDYFGIMDNVPRVAYRERGVFDEEVVRALLALLNVYERAGLKENAELSREHLITVGKSIRGPADSVNTTEVERSEELLGYIGMLLEGCLVDEALEVLDHEMLTRLAVHKVDHPLKSPWTARIQEHIDHVKEFDVTYCRPAPLEELHKRLYRP
ncbi:hypothetical protein BZA77DRAFT_344637 [Pyronema omphalodes]|nr:hypothetical protein BZA77DRAFT_344637 [Pyronema omphalodes]